MSYESAEQVFAKHVRDMGENLGCVYNALSNELSWLHVKWSLYRQLYAKSQARIDVLRRTADHFFGALRRTLADDVMLHLGRMTDSASTFGRENLTIQRLPALVPEGLRGEIETLVKAALGAFKPIHEWRNRRIAHTDLEWALSKDPFPGVTFGQLDAAVESLRALLNRLEHHYWQGPTKYEDVITPFGDADALVYYLWKGLSVDEQRKQRLLTGQPLPKDLKHEEPP